MNTETCEKLAAFSAALFGLATCSAVTPIAVALGGAAAALSIPSIIHSIGADRTDGIANRTVKRLSKQISANWRMWTVQSGEFSEDQITIAVQALDVVLPLIEISPSDLMAVGRDLPTLAELAAVGAKTVAPELFDASSLDPQSAVNLIFFKSIVERAAAALEGQPDYEASVAPWFHREVLRRFVDLEEKSKTIPSRTAELVSKQTAAMLAARLGIALRTGSSSLDPSRVRVADRHEILAVPVARQGAQTVESVNRIAQHMKTGGRERLGALVQRGVITEGSIAIEINQAALGVALGIATDAIAPEVLKLLVPFALRRRGIETRILAGSREPAPDMTMLRALAESHRIAAARLRGAPLGRHVVNTEQPSGSRERRKAWLAFLSPRIQMAILEGRHPESLSLERILQSDMPLAWHDQERLFGLVEETPAD